MKNDKLLEKNNATSVKDDPQHLNDTGSLPVDVFADLEATLDEVTQLNPRIESSQVNHRHADDLKAILEATLAINSSLVIEDILEIVMCKAIELMSAERGFVMLLDEQEELQIKTAHNINQDEMSDEELKISNTVAGQVIATGKSVYTSDALSDERYSQKQSVVELHLRSIMCVPLKVKEKMLGVIYLDNSSQSKMFLKSDLFLFELYAQMVSNALDNANVYTSIFQLKRYNDSVIEKSPVGLIVIDSRSRIATMNTRSLEIFDLNKEQIQLLGENDKPSVFIDLLPDNEKGRWEYMISTALETKEDFSNDRYFHNTGYIEKVLSIKISPIPQLTNGTAGLIMTVEDITDKVLMEKYVILSEKLVAKGEMAASVAHELNNYLAIASNNAELLTMNIERNKLDKVKFNCKSIVDNIFKIKRFVDSLMDFSKPDTDFITYDIKTLIEDLLFSLRIQPRFKQTHFTIDLGQNVPNVEMDVGLVQQVLMNLLNNAADTIEEKVIENDNEDFDREIGINVTYDKLDDIINVEISDNGKGMTDEVLSKIFNKHFTTKKSGHGLGLANCQKIIEQHHGDLSAFSQVGEGSIFKVVIPRFQPTKRDK